MKKKYYIAAMFAFGLVAQPAILRANAADEANSIEAVQQQKQRISGLLTILMVTLSSAPPVRVQGTTIVVLSVTSKDDTPSKLLPAKYWNSAILDLSV